MYKFVVWLHILMATVWVGGLIYTAAVVIPFAVSLGEKERQPVIRGLARRFRRIGWGAIVLLALTGIINIYNRIDIIKETTHGDSSVAIAAFMKLIGIKLALVLVMIGLMLYHDITSLRDARRSAESGAATQHNRGGSIAAAIATLLAVAILFVSVLIVRMGL
jgi:copper resistance protein D